jgi:hypothetical protein
MSKMNYEKLNKEDKVVSSKYDHGGFLTYAQIENKRSQKRILEDQKIKRTIQALIKKGKKRDHVSSSDFFKSLCDFFQKKGYLSPKQFRSLDKMIHGETFTQKNSDTFKTQYELDLELVSYFDVISNNMNEHDKKSYEFIIENLIEKKRLSESDQWLVDRMNRKYRAY